MMLLKGTTTCLAVNEILDRSSLMECIFCKGMNVDVKSLSSYENGYHPCFVVFDMLVVNEKKLANVPLSERVRYMDKMLKPKPGYLQFVERNNASTKEDVVKALNVAIDKRDEGLVVKSPSSVYKPSKRGGSGWVKIKPEYVDSLSDELDLLIVGGNFGVGAENPESTRAPPEMPLSPRKTNIPQPAARSHIPKPGRTQYPRPNGPLTRNSKTVGQAAPTNETECKMQ